ncbi:MAG TPA: adenosylcobinamide-GDP ribazoletransferase, partial [Methylomirabilota bacterium]|nr:adenosylcobinamide-GDP ribazoletransferase [Methylomirabilota bacterium]
MTDRSFVHRIAADLGGALRFFSRVPVPALSPADDPAGMPRFETGAWAAPVAGAILALPAALLAALLGLTALPALAAGALVAAVSVLATGGLHEDGLADTADGLGGGHDRERRLAIMKDSRIGVFGAAALALSLIARSALLGALVAAGPLAAAGAVIAAATVSRSAMVVVWNRLPAARSDGLSVAAGRPAAGAAMAAVVVGGLAALLAGPAAGFAGVLLAVALSALAAAAMAGVARRAIG